MTKDFSVFILLVTALFSVLLSVAQKPLTQNQLSFTDPFLFSFPKTSEITVSTLDTNKFVLAFRNDGYGGKGVSVIGEVMGGNVVFGPPEFFDEGVVGDIKVQGLSPTKFIIIWQDEKHAGIGKTIVGEVNYNFISYADSYTFNDKPTGCLSITSFNNYDCVIGFSDGGNFWKSTIKRIKVIGNYVTMLNEIVISDMQPGFTTLTQFSDTTFAILYSENNVKIRKGRISFDSVFIYDEQVLIGSNVDRFAVTRLFGRKFSYSSSDQGYEMTNKVVCFQDSLAFGKTDTISTGNAGNVKLSPLDTNHYLHVVSFENDSAFADIISVNGTVETSTQQKGFANDISNITLTALSSDKFIIAFSDDANNNSGKLILGTVSYMPGYHFNVKAFLEGPFNGIEMSSNTNILPVEQPYFESPQNYFGNEFLSVIPDNIVDWLLLEVRETNGNASTATSLTIIFRQAVFLSNDGTILSSDAISPLFLEFYQNGNLFLVLHHRNHLGIMSANPIIEFNGTFDYDFTDLWFKTYGGLAGCTQLASGSIGMTAGDANGSSEIDNVDKNDIWLNQFGGTGYLDSDINIDGIVDFDDNYLFWNTNSGKSSKVPD